MKNKAEIQKELQLVTELLNDDTKFADDNPSLRNMILDKKSGFTLSDALLCSAMKKNTLEWVLDIKEKEATK